MNSDLDLEKLRVPMWCPQCRSTMLDNKSNSTYYKYGVCINCYIEFIEDRENRWISGWRPSKEQVEKFYERLNNKT